MTWILGLFVMSLMQQQSPTPIPKVVVGLTDGAKVTLENAEFFGFIEGPVENAVLIYRQQKVHGKMPTARIRRIEFGPYHKEKPFALSVTLVNGEKLELESERHDYVMLTGLTELGTVRIKHPDPISAPLQIRTRKPDRKDALTIQYLEFPPS